MALLLNDAELEALHSTLFRLETRWHQPIHEPSPYHAWDSLPFWLFLNGIHQADQLITGRRFLDIGCGIGTKLALMHHLGWHVSGIERHGPYADAARELVPEADVVHADAFDIGVFDADLVYMYRPARDDELETRLERHVTERIPQGAVVFFPLRRNPEVWVA